MTEEIKVQFEPSGRTVYVLPNTSLLEAAARAGFILDTPCGGHGTCGKCLVHITAGNCPTCDLAVQKLPSDQIKDGWRMACQCRVQGPLTVTVPSSSLFQSGQQVLSHDSGEDVAVSSRDGLGVAIDIGTTTLVTTLLNLHTGEELAVAGTMNPQTSRGDDLISRIKTCRDEPDGLKILHSAVAEGINGLISEVSDRAGVASDSITEVVVAGNTAMQQIFCGIDSSGLGEIPFEPAFTDPQILTAGELGLAAKKDAEVFVFPQIGGFVGGDTVSGILATNLYKSTGSAMLIDIGTNGEIVLAENGSMLATSVAAGPAFEGARITNGMRAMSGAIEKVMVEKDIVLNVIGNTAPSGICGSGLIDAASEFLRVGIIDSVGRIVGPDEAPDTVPPALIPRLKEQDGHYDIILADAKESGTGSDLCLYQRDVRELQLANGAIRAGVRILLKLKGKKVSDLDAVYIAGAFGNFIRRKHAKRIGMLPSVPNEKIRFVGNAASFGAKRVLLDPSQRETVKTIRNNTEHVDLSTDPDFQMEFASAMIFP